MITGLTGMDVSNASVYDGAIGSWRKPCLMAARCSAQRISRARMLISGFGVHPHCIACAAREHRDAIRGLPLIDAPCSKRRGRVGSMAGLQVAERATRWPRSCCSSRTSSVNLEARGRGEQTGQQSQRSAADCGGQSH